jgi:hypothetical protein
MEKLAILYYEHYHVILLVRVTDGDYNDLQSNKKKFSH